MRHLHLTVAAAVLISTAWAQAVRSLSRVGLFDPELKKQMTRHLIALDPPGAQPTHSVQRIANHLPPLTWLKPSQDADTVPVTSNTLPDFAGDTLLANNAGQDIDPNVDENCHHGFFDRAAAGYVWVYTWRAGGPAYSNYLLPTRAVDTLQFYIGGGVAERYDIDPCALAGTGNSIYIKGAAAWIANRKATEECITSQQEVQVPQFADGAYTIWYELRDTLMTCIDVGDEDNPDIRPATYPADSVLAYATKPISDVRIGIPRAVGQCVQPQINLNFPVPNFLHRLERYDHAYFPTPIEVDTPKSYYVILKFELYIPNVDDLFDSLCTALGPAQSPDNYPEGFTCFTGDTLTYGRQCILGPVQNTNSGEWVYPDRWLVDATGLNFTLHPIIYEAPGSNGGVAATCQNSEPVNSCPTTGQVVRMGTQGFGLPYPNPAVDCINLKLTTPAATRGQFMLYTVDGQQVAEWSRPVPAGESTISLDLPAVPAGSYILHARTPYGLASFWVNVVK